jgi:hypothetical protein
MVRYNATDLLLKELQKMELLLPEDGSMFRVGSSPDSSLSSSSFSNSFNLSIFVYDTILEKFSHVQDEMRRKYADGNSNNNWMADIAIIDSFTTYPGRTHDPQSAQIFIVPYPSASHCLWEAYNKKWQNQCMHVSADTIKKEVLGNLLYYRGNKNRHLFINTMDYWLVHPSIRNVPLSINLGPRHTNENVKHIVIPYLNDKESFQPPSLSQRKVDWWTRERTFSLAYFFGAANKRMKKSQRIQRLYFLEEVRTNWTSPVLGDLPFVVASLQQNQSAPSDYFESVYQNSIFCPTLPGKHS